MEIPSLRNQSPKGGNGSSQTSKPNFVEDIPNKLPNNFPAESSMVVGAKTLAGIGLGLILVIGATTVVGLAVETVVVPSLLLKLAGGIAGGGLGMAKGLSDERKTREPA